MSVTARHGWLVGARRADRAGAATGIDGNHLGVDCHRRLRGPYSGAGALVRALVPLARDNSPRLVRDHLVEILSVAPELRETLGAPPETLTSLAIPEERIRFYSPLRTRRLAHGLVEFVAGCAELRPLTLFFDNAHAADPTDQEFLAILVRRASPGTRVLVGTATTDLPDSFAAALREHTATIAVRPAPATHADDADLVRRHVDSDGTTDDPAEIAAYACADAALRAALHDRRAAELESLGDWPARLGAVPYHRERGTDPAGAGVAAWTVAFDWCLSMGYYHAVLDGALRCRDLLDPDTQPQQYLRASTRAGTALAVLGRPDEAERIYRDLRARHDDPMTRLLTGYALAMLHTRFHPRRDHVLARAHIEDAIAAGALAGDPAARTFHTVFCRNGLALIEANLGNLTEALALVDDGLASLDRELGPDRHRLHRSVLLHNRAQVHAALGDLDAALADLTAVLEADPHYPEYHVDRAAILRRRGEHAAALADYDRAVELTPPIAELHYNRADLHAELGNTAEAVADLAYVLELEPADLLARVALATLLLESGDEAAARRHVDEGLARHPGDPDLLATKGLLIEDAADARAAFEQALAADPGSVVALAGRAALHHEAGDHLAAVADLTVALAHAPDDPDLLHNRGIALRAAGRRAAAVGQPRSCLV
ncbi:tetratricopeptide repeat protein [Solihabitans fulvus]|uniref:Tetratricopeptide repeat protein n=1 Tax=Solihabitans fulvus TaxID=1892852 RepID=A0A5B2WVL7_9PSEU|nr:tetratricopeptide repeat protein [Solihabitans fulvus]KAA2254489.1 tetratricopeptide repeat protein [Solihabitans fulvus]